ncbi:MAG TPA: Crp/Fnr family transcriptional regulator [Terriglobia bacterium]|nr:Crp/Fnr family transcriptional regulator [Terriglobia bacterium]
MRSPYGFEIIESCQSCSQKKTGFFCDLPPSAAQAFDAIKLTNAYPDGSVLFAEGDEPRGVFILCRGRVKLSVTSGDGKTLILRIAGPGEVLGLHGVISAKPFQATAETLEPCQINYVRREDFLRFLRERAEASLDAARELSYSYQVACEQVRSLGLANSAPAKLAGFLLDWAAKGSPAKEGTRVTLTLTHEEIGQMVGLSRETVTRTFGEFKHRQLVSVKGATLVIQNKPALEQFAGAS